MHLCSADAVAQYTFLPSHTSQLIQSQERTRLHDVMKRFFTTTFLSFSLLSGSVTHAQQTVELNEKFTHLASKLKPGGPHYSVSYVEGDFTSILETIDSFFLEAIKANKDSAQTEKIMKMLEKTSFTKVFSTMGFGLIAAKGSSVTPIADNYWHNRSYMSYAKKRKGLIRILGDETTPWQAPLYAPAGADLVLETALNAKFLLPLLREILKDTPKEGINKFNERLTEPLFPGSPLSIEEAMNQTNVQASLALTLDTTKKWSPEPGVTLPGFTAAGRVQGLKPYWPLLEKQLTGTLPRTEKDDLISFIIPQEIPTPFGKIQPHIIYNTTKDILWVQMNGSPLDAIADVKGRLALDPDFQKATTDIPAKGSSLIYVSTEMQQQVLEMAKTAIEKESSAEKGNSEAIMITKLFDYLKPSEPLATALVSEEDGLFMALNAPIELKGSNSLSPIFILSTLSGAIITAYDGFQRKAEILRKLEDTPAPTPAE